MSDLTDDRIALRYLVEAYAGGCDARDASVLANCFADGATLTVHWPDRDATLMRFPEAAERIPGSLAQYDRTMHFVGNHQVQIDGNLATGVTYCFAHHIRGRDDHVMAIRYFDTYRRDPDGWKIVDRQLRLDWTEDTTVNG